MCEFINNKDQLDLLRNDETLISSAIEEILRYHPPIQVNNRRNKEDTILENKKIPKGTSVHMIIAAANRDPKQFNNPDSAPNAFNLYYSKMSQNNNKNVKTRNTIGSF